MSNHNTNPRMHLSHVSIALLLLFSLTACTATGNNPSNLISQVSINCGSSGTSSALNGKDWIGDVQPKFSSMLTQIEGKSTTSAAIHDKSISIDPVPHKTARLSCSQFSYEFQLNPGQKILRLHFNPAPYKGFRGLKDLFTVEAGRFILLSNFSASLTARALGVNSLAKEFFISIEEKQKLNIVLSPVSSQSQDSTYAFINGIQIISVPNHISYFNGGDLGAQVIGQESMVFIDNSTALELIHRINVKQDSVSSGDDFDGMLGMWETVKKQKTNEINNLTWKKSVDVGFRYLVRIYFCEPGLKLADTGGVIFEVLINEKVVATNTDIVKGIDYDGVLRYRDYMVANKGQKQEGKRDLLISLQSYDEEIDGHKLLKGFEIYKLSNPDNSLASPNALPPARDPPPWIIQKLLLFPCLRNAISTIATAIIAVTNIIIYKLRKIWEAGNTEDENNPSARAERICRHFSLAEIKTTTKNFSDALVIGKGGFGKVYKGLIDNGHKTIAIKRLKSSSEQGKHEFLTEIETLSELRHINLVPLIGYCTERKEMILIYEYMACGTLADQLYKLARNSSSCSTLTWKQRQDICIGAGRGLDYLHTGHGVIHRDVKASNILLDENFVAKVSDFGLARPEERSKLQSHVSTKVKGTFGYFDPYYLSTHKLTRKSDTYAFGVVLLEVLCGRPAMDPVLGEEKCYLTKWAQNRIIKGEINQIIDSNLIEEISPDSLRTFVGIAEKCLHDEPKNRPTMAQVVLELEFALEQQESRKFIVPNKITSVTDDVCPSDDENISPVNTEQQRVASSGVQTVASDTEQTNREMVRTDTSDGKIYGRKPKTYKPLWPWADAFRKGLKLFKKKELVYRSASEICEAEINLPKFDFAKISAATNQFSSSNRIGEGSFGSVYKAVFPTGQTVAIKRFSFPSLGFNEFRSEILLVSHLHHRNIIKLLGYCIHERGGVLLYEFMENRSLDTFIFDEVQRHQLQWSIRFEIIMGVTKAVIYLHRDSGLRIIHRDLKPGNIFLDIEMNPKLSGFGIAKTFEEDESEVETRVAGTIGYISPECIIYGKLSEKVDVYSIGVVVLEILSGKKNMEYPRHEINLIGHAWQLWNDNRVFDLVDESLCGAYSENEALRCIQVGLLCTQYEPHKRPTMPSVLKMLAGEELSLQEKVAEAASYRGNMEWDGAFNAESP